MSRELDTNFKAEKSEAPAENTFNQTTPISQSDQKLLLGIISEQQKGAEKLPPLSMSDSEGTLIAGGTGGNKECRRYGNRDARQGLCNMSVDTYKFTKPATDVLGRGVDAGRRVIHGITSPFEEAQRAYNRAQDQRNHELQRRSVEAARERAEFNKTNSSAESRALHRYEQIQNAKRRR